MKVKSLFSLSMNAAWQQAEDRCTWKRIVQTAEKSILWSMITDQTLVFCDMANDRMILNPASLWEQL